MFIFDDILIFGGAALLTALAVCAISVAVWLVSVAIKRLISYIKEIGVRSAVLRKKKAIEKFIKAAEKNGEPEIAKELKRVNDSAAGLLVPVTESSEENWEDLKVVGAQNEEQDDLVDAFMFADTGRVKAL